MVYLCLDWVLCGSAARDTDGWKSAWGGIDLYGKSATAFLVLSSIGYITSEHALNWDIGFQIYFLSYFLIGYKIRRWGAARKNNARGIILIVCGCGVNMALALLNYMRALNGLPVDVALFSENPVSFGPLAPLEVVASLLVFAGFSRLEIKLDLSRLAGDTYLIYLVHAGVLSVFQAAFGNHSYGSQTWETIAMIVQSAAVFLISWLVAVLYRKGKERGKRHIHQKG